MEKTTYWGRKSPLYGRRTAQIRLLPFDYADAAKFLTNTSPQELVQYYATSAVRHIIWPVYRKPMALNPMCCA